MDPEEASNQIPSNQNEDVESDSDINGDPEDRHSDTSHSFPNDSPDSSIEMELEQQFLSNDELNIDIDENEDDGSSDNINSGELTSREGNPRTLLISVDRVHSAINELIMTDNEDDISAPVNRDGFMQRLRRAIFSLDHNRQRLNASNGTESNASEENENDFLSYDDNNIDEENQRLDEPENSICFDTNLPAEHSYLGNNMNRVSGVNYLDVGHTYKMILFLHQHILFPGEVLPFMVSDSIFEDVDASNGLLFGVCFLNMTDSDNDENIYGVTCQIYEKGTNDRGNTLIKSRALQRFISKKSSLSGTLQLIASHPELRCYGYIRILPEIYLPEPLKCINMGSMNRFRGSSSMHDMYKRFQAATTPWPTHIYEHYSISSIVEKARTLLVQHKIDTMPTDPIQLSFWLVRNLHLSESMMKNIFISDSVNMRMKLISDTFQKDSIYICRYCGNRIAKCSELFAMSKHGVQTQYCNSAGYIHETNTVYQLLRDAISYSGEPSAEFSWFPGYQWHIVICKICARHIGWEFKALEPKLVPRTFFGISSCSVRVSTVLNVPVNHRAVIYRNLMRIVLREREME